MDEKPSPKSDADAPYSSPTPTTDEMLSEVAELFKVFGDFTRVRILFVLSRQAACVQDIATELSMTPSAISHQLRILKTARLVRSERDGKTMYYSLADDHVTSIFEKALDHIREKK